MHGLCAKDIRQMIKQYMEIALADEQNDIGPTLSTFVNNAANIMPTLTQQMTFIWVDIRKKNRQLKKKPIHFSKYNSYELKL